MMFAKGSERFPPPKDITPGPGAYDPKLMSHDVGFKEFAKQAGDRFSDDIQEGEADNIVPLLPALPRPGGHTSGLRMPGQHEHTMHGLPACRGW